MLKIRKVFSVKIVALIVGISFLLTSIPSYAYHDSKDTLRVQLGEERTSRRMFNAEHKVKIDIPLRDADPGRRQPIELSELEENPMFRRMFELLRAESGSLADLADSLIKLCSINILVVKAKGGCSALRLLAMSGPCEKRMELSGIYLVTLLIMA